MLKSRLLLDIRNDLPALHWRDAELGQAHIRLVVASLAILYIIVLYYCGGLDRSSLERILVCYIGVMFAAIWLWRHIKRRPGIRHWRRLLAMSFDYGSLTYSMFLAGEQLLALHGVILWITVGNGLRYGRGYLLLATALALGSLALVVPFTPFLLRHPAVPLALLITTVIVPGYIYYLLEQLQRALRETEVAQRAKARFLAQASHDLRQPIHA
ncbi:hybrid sensor histidine kinase/response regulator, partial [Pseudomonas oryzihabitans]|nr:hybrid sensor histidine kinase/response regulator [Pseudomonas oryzihabitans]